MSDPNTFTAEHRSWQWELVLQYEDGSLPASAWNESTLGVIAGWYAANLPADQAKTRYEQAYHRNIVGSRTGSTSAVQSNAIEALDKVWESLLTRALATQDSPKPDSA